MNDEDFRSGTHTSATGFAATVGTTYDIQVGGTGSAPTGNVHLAITTAALAGTMTFAPVASSNDPSEGCILFYPDATLTTPVATGCGSGNHGGTASFSLGSVPAGTYYLEASDGGDNTVVYQPGATSPGQLVPITVPGGGCTLTGMSLNFGTLTWTAPTGRDRSSAPACISARAGQPGADAAVAAATTALALSDTAKASAAQAVTSILKRLRAAKRHHHPTRRLLKRLRSARARLASATAADTAAADALASARSARAAGRAAVGTSC